MRNQLDKIIITAMDRFVWFVILVVVSHLVTEFTRVTGHARGPRHISDAVSMNNSLGESLKVQNMVLYPGEEYDALFNLPANVDENSNSGADAVAADNALQSDGKTYSLRPLFDSILEIPRTTFRAFSRLLAYVTGNSLQQQYEQPTSSHFPYAPRHLVDTDVSAGPGESESEGETVGASIGQNNGLRQEFEKMEGAASSVVGFTPSSPDRRMKKSFLLQEKRA